MKNLKKLGASAVLTFALGLTALAGEIPTMPCAPPEPGQMPTPCETSQAATQPAPAPDPGQTNTPPASNLVDIVSVAEGAMNVLQSMLAVF